MNREFVRQALRDALLVSGIATIVAAFAGDGVLALGVLVGALLAIGDLWVLHVLVGKLVESAKRVGLMNAPVAGPGGTPVLEESEAGASSGAGAGAGAALAVFGLVTKLGVLMALIYLSSSLLGASLVGIAMGFGLVLTVAVVDAVRIGTVVSHA